MWVYVRKSLIPSLLEVSFLDKLLPRKIRDRQIFTCTSGKPGAQSHVLLANKMYEGRSGGC